MTYKLYDGDYRQIETCHDVREALQVFGEWFDNTRDGDAVVHVYISIAGNEKYYNSYEILDFLNKSEEEILKDRKAEIKEDRDLDTSDLKEFSRRAKNFSPSEQKETLLYIPTGFILGELARRFSEYQTAMDQITQVLDVMKIFNEE